MNFFSMSFLKQVHVARLLVQHQYEMLPLTHTQLLSVIKYQMGRKYDMNHLINVHHKPYFLEKKIKYDIYFFGDREEK